MDDRWHCAIADYLKWLEAAGRSADTVRQRRFHLWRVARAVDRSPWAVTLDDLTDFMSGFDWKPETRRAMQSSIQTFYRWAIRTGQCVSSPAAQLATVRVAAGRPRPAPQVVLECALAQADEREWLMLVLGAYAGLRRKEISEVHSCNVISELLHVHGKGDKERVVPLHPVVLERLLALPAGYAFPGKIDGHLSADRVGVIMSELLGEGWTAHTLRHAFATNAYAVERDLLAVQELLGHASPVMTARYTELPSDALRRAVMGAGPLVAA